MAKKKRKKQTNKASLSAADKLRAHVVKHAILYGAIASIIVIVILVKDVGTYLYEEYSTWMNERDQNYTGIWTNPTEGCIDCTFNNDPKRPIVLDITVEDGEVGGVLDASYWLNLARADIPDKYLPPFKNQKEKEFHKAAIKIGLENMFKFVEVRGSLGFRGGTIFFTDIIQGQRVLIGKAEISLEDGILNMQMLGNHFLGIPDKAELYPLLNFNGLPCKKPNGRDPNICDDD